VRPFALRPLVVGVGLLSVYLFLAPSALAYTFGPTVQQLGPEQTVFDWNTMRCNDNFAADSPARAWKDSAGKVHLTLSSNATHAMVGSSLDTVAVDCAHTLLPSEFNPDPSTYDDQEWIGSTYTPDGKTVYGLIHDEHHGAGTPGQCPLFQNDSTKCWYNAITFGTSTDKGYSFTHAAPPGHLLASVPYKYAQWGSPYGYFSPSNIVKKSDGYYYFMFQAQEYGAQQIGACEARSKNPANPTSWRAWDGAGFNIQFINPYTNPDPPENHVCAPVQYDDIEKMVQSLTYNSYFNKYLLLGNTQAYDPIRQQWVYGFYYSTSSDLLNWSPRTLLLEIPLLWNYQCGAEEPGLYPAVLNPTSTDRNFGTTGQSTYLYFTRFHHDQNCVQTRQMDLIRIPINFVGSPSSLVPVDSAPKPGAGLTSFAYHVSWVRAYKRCRSPNAQHSPPLAVRSCSPGALVNPNVVAGPSATSWPLNLDYVARTACPGGSGGHPIPPDVCIQTSLNDVETATGAPYDPSPRATGADLGAVVRMRLTDNYNCTPTPCSGHYKTNASTIDFDFGPIPIDCEAATSARGSNCALATTANTFMPGSVVAGKHTNVQLFRPRLIQPGAPAASQLVAQQGLAWP
jgi:hypothetical protein